eukprot:CAMPEP_0184492038 /NCGR_PEP_ID=MMETSP0113_2-20130426/22093_1 /TAXON_ID=91329 /ORGANISM="Norrisiella sphaerica, Strain BC52" /LENGTH=329 /DNA_ID=CAMNT_0026876649 /DNA_START=184 /DNA_END=1173 /DNA_ORIENTATION=-
MKQQMKGAFMSPLAFSSRRHTKVRRNIGSGIFGTSDKNSCGVVWSRSSSSLMANEMSGDRNSSITLEYLPFRAMAETTRFILRYGNIQYKDVVVWGQAFQERRLQGRYPFNMVPVMHISLGRGNDSVMTVAQSGSLARYAAKLSGCYPSADPNLCVLNDAVFELAQEMCTINPLINCYVGSQHTQIKEWYFSKLPSQLKMLERQLWVAASLAHCFKSDHKGQKPTGGGSLAYFGGETPSHADFNVYHHLSNACLVEPECVGSVSGELVKWMERMEALPSMKEYLEERPELVGIGEDPGLLDKSGRFLTQRDPEGLAILHQGLFHFSDEV